MRGQGRNQLIFSGGWGGGKMTSLLAAPNKYIRLWKFRGGNCPIAPLWLRACARL